MGTDPAVNDVAANRLTANEEAANEEAVRDTVLAAGVLGPGRFYEADYQNPLTSANKAGRVAWGIVSSTLFRCSPVPCFGWRRFLLRLFGARLAATARVYPTTRIWAPWNLVMENDACLGPDVHCLNVATLTVGPEATVSFGTVLCAASHDIHSVDRRLIAGPIRIERGAFLFAEAFVCMDVTIGEGAVVAARAFVRRSVGAYDVVAGNPAQIVSRRRVAAPPG
jgi:putative colanic acid biosynthesis acetyltransferase WcaF